MGREESCGFCERALVVSDGEREAKIPLNVFGVSAEICRVVYLVFEKLQSSISHAVVYSSALTMIRTMPVTLLPIKFAGWLTLFLCIRK